MDLGVEVGAHFWYIEESQIAIHVQYRFAKTAYGGIAWNWGWREGLG